MHGRLRHELYIDTGDATMNDELFEALARRATVSRKRTEDGSNGKTCLGKPCGRIADYTSGSVSTGRMISTSSSIGSLTVAPSTVGSRRRPGLVTRLTRDLDDDQGTGTALGPDACD